MPFQKKEKQQSKEAMDLSKVTFADLEKEANAEAETRNAKEANKLVRCRIMTNDPDKQGLFGEIFTVRNSRIPAISKFIPYDKPTHIPEIMLSVIREKQFQKFVESTDGKGNKITKTSMIPMYNIEILPPLTNEELKAIKQKQLAENYKPGEE